MARMNYSRQREAIINYLRSVSCHPTAEKVYEHIREEFPNISLATVYRNLNQLAASGDIRKVSCGEARERFDGNTSRHYHFICNECNEVMDLEMEPLDHVNTLAGARFSGDVQGHSIYFFGLCDSCLSKKTIDKP